jgi:biotin carboxylase
MLGGADIQVSAIKRAKELGCYVITCDYLPNNPGHAFADEYHNVSTTDREAVLALARSLNLDGILAYASDPAAPTAAYVAEMFGLPGNPYLAVEILSRKDLLRQFMHEHGFRAPKAISSSSYREALEFHQSLQSDSIIKPVDSSGSKGIFRLSKGKSFEGLFHEAMRFSKLGLVVVEEFIEKLGYQIGGDGFLVDGQLVFRCFGDIHFSKTNPLLPCSVSLPSSHEPDIIQRVHSEVQSLLSAIGMQTGALNFDILVNKSKEVCILEIGPRNGGNMIPELTELCTGVDMKTYSIRAALGLDCSGLQLGEERKAFAHYVVHAPLDGVVQSVEQSKQLRSCIRYEHYNFKPGDQVERFNSSANRLGVLLLEHADQHALIELIDHMHEHLRINLQQ